MSIYLKSIFLRRVKEACSLRKISKKTATHFISVYNKLDLTEKSQADEKADELLAELITETSQNIRK